MSSCLSGGAGRTYGFDLDIVKSPSSPSSRSSSHSSSSPSSTLSESSNSAGLAISTKRARAPRKRPNQTYTEAAALLSTIYPNVFSANNLLKLYNRAARPHDDDSFSESSDLLPPFPPPLNDAGFLLLRQPVSEITDFRIESTKPVNSPETGIRIPPDSDFFRGPNSPCLEEEEDFDAESILDEEMVGGEGIDSIMGNLSVDTAAGEDSTPTPDHYYYYHSAHVSPYLGNHPMGFGLGGKFEFGFGFGFGCNMRAALRRADDGEWWRSPTVPVLNMAPKHRTSSSSEKKKKKNKKKKNNKVEKVERKETKVENDDSKGDSEPSPSLEGNLRSGFSLKLNYEEVLKAWSDQGSPFSDAKDSTESHADAIARLAQIELFPEEMGGSGGGGGVREASVMRYKEKRRSRLFSKKIRYQVRKVNADTRPRMQGRFVRRPSLLR